MSNSVLKVADLGKAKLPGENVGLAWLFIVLTAIAVLIVFRLLHKRGAPASAR